MTIVSDTGPILHLHEADGLRLMASAETVSIPPGINGELTRLVPNWSAMKPAWLLTQELHPASAARASDWHKAGLLHLGEAEALALALELQASWFLTDDAAARVFAESLGVETHGSLGLVLWSAGQGRLNHRTAAEMLEALFESSLWISPRVRTEARRALEGIFR